MRNQISKFSLLKSSSSICLNSPVKIGPFSIVKAHSSIGKNTSIGSHVVIESYSKIGENNKISHGVFIGGDPQDNFWLNLDKKKKKAHIQCYFVDLGNDNIINENVIIHRGVHRKTKIGNRNFIMGQVHIAHDVCLEDDIHIANQSILAGGVKIGKAAFISGHVAVHQNVLIGRYSMIGASSYISQDVPPYALVAKGFLYGINSVALKKFNFSYQEIDFIKKIYSALFFKKRVTLQDKYKKLSCFEKKISTNTFLLKKEKLSFLNIIDEFKNFFYESKRALIKCPEHFYKAK